MLILLLYYFNQVFHVRITPTGSISIDKCIFSDIVSTGHGGAISASSLSLYLARSSFSKISSTGWGGMIYLATGDNTYIQCCSFSDFNNDYGHAGKCICALMRNDFSLNGSVVSNPVSKFGYEIICNLGLHYLLNYNNLSSNVNQNRAGVIMAHDNLSPSVFKIEYSIFTNNTCPNMIYVADSSSTVKVINRISIVRCQDSTAFYFKYPTQILNSNIIHPENKLGVKYVIDSSCITHTEIANFVPLSKLSDDNCLIMQINSIGHRRSRLYIIETFILPFFSFESH